MNDYYIIVNSGSQVHIKTSSGPGAMNYQMFLQEIRRAYNTGNQMERGEGST